MVKNIGSTKLKINAKMFCFFLRFFRIFSNLLEWHMMAYERLYDVMWRCSSICKKFNRAHVHAWAFYLEYSLILFQTHYHLSIISEIALNVDNFFFWLLWYRINCKLKLLETVHVEFVIKYFVDNGAGSFKIIVPIICAFLFFTFGIYCILFLEFINSK